MVLMGASSTFSSNAEPNHGLPAGQGPGTESNGVADAEHLFAGGSAIAQPLAAPMDGPSQLFADAYHDHVVITWSMNTTSLPGPIDGYRLSRDSSAGGSFSVYLSPDATTYNDTGVQPYTEYTYTLVAYDGEVTGEAAVIEVLTPDPYPPVVAIDRPSEGEVVKTSDIAISWHGDDNCSGIASYWVKVNDGVWRSAGLEESFEVPGLPEGRSEIFVKAVAMAGNTAIAQVNVTVDALPPSVTIVSPANGTRTSSPVVSWEGFDSVTGASYEVILDDGASTLTTSSNEVRFDDLDQGRHTVQVRASDDAGNLATAEVEFFLDTVSPTLIDRGPTGESVAADTTIWMTFSEEMNTSSVSVFLSGTAGTGSWSGNTLALVPFAPLRAGASYTVTVSGEDLAGNLISERWTFTVIAPATLTGQVLDPDGRPLEGVVVTLGDGRTAVTDRYGAFSIEAGEGRHDITFTMPGYLSTTSTVILSPGQSAFLGAVALAADTSGDLYWATVDVLVGTVLLSILLFICRRR